MKVFLGIDTSCYTTSAAVFTETGELLGSARKLLSVPSGKRGLAQSEMVFQHTRNLPIVLKEALAEIEVPQWGAVSASCAPRPLANSYMPAFLVGKGVGEAIALTSSVPFFGLSHQENHMYAGIWSGAGPKASSFLALHASGGTTELLRVQRQSLTSMTIDCIAATDDISAGQFIDRLGVRLGLPFPAGPHLEKLARESQATFHAGDLPVVCKQGRVSFSGPETALMRLIDKGETSANIAAAAQWIVAHTLGKMIEQTVASTGLREVLLVGGVLSNAFLRSYLIELAARNDPLITLFFAAPEVSSDHAVGAAYFSYLRHSLK